MRYNWVMIQSHRLRLWLTLALIAALIAAAALWLRGTLSDDTTSTSPIRPPTRAPAGTSPLPTPTRSTSTASPPRSWSGAGAALLWVALGGVLALAIATLILRRYRDDA